MSTFIQKTDLSLLPEIINFVEITLYVEMSTATAEKQFSSLRHLKIYLNSTTDQAQLNHITILNTVDKESELKQMNCVTNEFINGGVLFARMHLLYSNLNFASNNFLILRNMCCYSFSVLYTNNKTYFFLYYCSCIMLIVVNASRLRISAQ